MNRSLTEDYDKSDILGLECKHVNYAKARAKHQGSTPDDFHLVKEIVHLKDGRRVPRVRGFVNVERPFWIVKEGHQKYKEYREWESIDKLTRYSCTQADLVPRIKKALSIPYSTAYSVRALASGPKGQYIYGADISSTALLKRKYMDKWPDLVSENSVAILDLETDVVKGTEDPIYGALTFKDKAVLCATREFVADVPDFESAMIDYFYRRIPDALPKVIKVVELVSGKKSEYKNVDDFLSATKGKLTVEQIEQGLSVGSPVTINGFEFYKAPIDRGIKLEVIVCDGPLDLVTKLIAKAHEWMPDILAIWNINFDIPKIISTIEKYGGNIHDIFSDPCVPRSFRNVYYKEGPSKKVTQGGKEMPLHWVERWHTLYCCASFYVVDQAAIFATLRFSNGKEPTYGLDAILKKHAGIAKLKNEEADKYEGLDWHIYMQSKAHMKMEYGVYCLFDCISCEILDEMPNVRDLSQQFSLQCGHSDYSDFPRQPRRIVDDMHFTCINDGYVIGTTPSDLTSEFDLKTHNIRGWIVTLPAHLLTDNGLQNIKGLPNVRSKTYVGVYDQMGHIGE